MSRRFKIILTISVCLNLMLLGVLGGMFYKKLQWRRGAVAIAQADFSPEGRNVVARNFRAAHRDMGDKFQQSRAKRKALVEMLKQEDFDEQAYERNVQELKTIQNDLMGRKMEMLKKLALELPPEDRQKITAKFIKPYGPKRHKRGAHKHNKRHSGKDIVEQPLIAPKPSETPTR